jgi:biopolymer transport protein ExbB
MASQSQNAFRIFALFALGVAMAAFLPAPARAQTGSQSGEPVPVATPVQASTGGQDVAGINGFEIPGTAAAPAPVAVRSRSLVQLLTAGGPLMIPIVFCSFVLVVFALERTISLRRNRIIPGPFTRKFLEQLRAGDLTREQAIAVCEKNASPVSRVFLAGVLKWGRSGIEVEQAVLDAGERVSNDLRRYLRMINGVATVCPLLGLLGTVFGMIDSFDAISTATGSAADQKALTASGISAALITTAAGMSVAIPALILYLSLSSLVERRVTEIDSLGMKLVSLVSAESMPEQGRGGRSRKAA